MAEAVKRVTVVIGSVLFLAVIALVIACGKDMAPTVPPANTETSITDGESPEDDYGYTDESGATDDYGDEDYVDQAPDTSDWGACEQETYDALIGQMVPPSTARDNARLLC